MRSTRLRLFLTVVLIALIVGPAAFTQPGPGGKGTGRGGEGGGMRFRPNPDDMFKQLSGGAASFSVSSVQIPEMFTRFEPADKQKERMTAFLQKKGVTNGTMTKELYAEFFEDRMREMRERFSAMRQGGGAPPAAPGTPPTPGGSPPPGGSTDDVEAQAKEAFRRLDTNSDNVLDEKELEAVRRFSRIAEERERWDRNKNGKIEWDEYLEYFKDRQASRGRERERGGDRGGDRGPSESAPPPVEEKRPVVYRAGNLPKDLPGWFAQTDSDKDGQVGLYEWKSQGRTVTEFVGMDANGDGFVTVEEMLRHQKAASKEPADAGNGDPSTASRGGPPGMRPQRGGGGERGEPRDGKRERFSRMRWGNRPPGR